MALCKYCQKEITWMRTLRRSVPIENDGTVHECKEYGNVRKSVRSLEPESLSPEEIARYEKGVNKS